MPPVALIINPWVTDFKLYDEWMHPLGLYFLMARLMENGVDCRFFNCLSRSSLTKSKKFSTGDFEAAAIPKPAIYGRIRRTYKRYGVSREKLEYFLRQSPSPSVIFVGSMMTYWAPGIVTTVEVIREVFPRAPIVLGGIGARLVPSYFRTVLPDIYLFEGDLFSKNPIDFPGLSSMLPFTDTPSFLQVVGHIDPVHHGAALTSLGCPLMCSYCASASLQPRWFRRPRAIVTREIDAFIGAHAIRDIAFYDDALLYKAEEMLIPACLKYNGESLRFHTPNGLHLKFLDRTKAKAMKEAGFETLRFGYESGSDLQRRHTGGKGSRKVLEEKVRVMMDAGFRGDQIGIYIMAGLENQAPEDVFEEIAFIGSLGVRAQPVYLSPVPSTALYEAYADRFPQLRTDPLTHNDHYFITLLPGWSETVIDEIRDAARDGNARLIIDRSATTKK